ncbi:hypothetical protein I6J18_12455 [Peribacillus psychrosaccharolyticus]|uniref:Uncharacterized protein n=1 Tax=Peribacillus psychrosaccharolyticus TaxID=1407 RepID=A0A974S2Q5_PERPY|nr:hypothetical protein [Peribacillus psychrosaccharolyticus]MEC2057624.1 hypothetical protein [Peribacillus psychrosaccharolyticus]MED3744769.1 hypothetical protein [Peribacillus psychrosaccharolyticus]QQT02818.1 hypothetical protein I6J18_12455 [Peribacillus psychrosaccharolyticus]
MRQLENDLFENRELMEVRLGSPWSDYPRLLIEASKRIKKPVYKSYEELEEILKEAFLLYEDLKFGLINLYNEQ